MPPCLIKLTPACWDRSQDFFFLQTLSYSVQPPECLVASNSGLGAQPGITPGEAVPLSLGSAHVPSSAPSLDMDQGGLPSPVCRAMGGWGEGIPGLPHTR